MRKPIALVVSLLACAAFATGASSSAGAEADPYIEVAFWGEVPGGGPGELAYPSAISVSPDGQRVFVADTQNDRVQVFSPQGAPVGQWSVTHPTSLTSTRARDLFTLARRSSSSVIGRYSQMTGRELDTWKPTGRPSIVADLFSTTEIASSDAAGAPIYGLGFCPNGVECRRASDFVMRWSPSGQITGTWNIHEDLDYHGADGYVYATALAADHQGNFYVARKENFIYRPGEFHYGESNEWIEKYGSNGRLIARTPNIFDWTGELAIQSLAVDPNTGDVLFKNLVGVFSVARDFQSEPKPTGIRSYTYSELAIDCRSSVYVLSVFSGGVSKYASRSPGNSCQAAAPLPGKAVTLAPPRVKTVGPRETAVVQPVTCRIRCSGILKVVTKGPSPSIIAQVRFTLPAGGGSVVLPLTGHGQSLAAQGGVLNVSVTATVAGSNVPVSIVSGILKDSSITRLICPPGPQKTGVPFQVGGTVTPAPSVPGRVAVAFGQSSATNSLGYLAGEWLPAAAAGAGRYTRVLTARAPGTWHVQMVSLGDQAHEGSRSGICSLTVAPGPPPPAPTLPAPSVSVADASVPEGNTGGSVATVTVTLSAASSSPVSVAFTTLSGTATSGQDFAPASGRVTFPIGTTAQTIPVTVIGDTTLEPDETFAVQLSDPVNAMIARGTGTVTIKNDDLPPAGAHTLSISDASVKEGNSGTNTMSFTVSLSPASTSQVKVDFATRDGSASAGSDYQAANGTLAFNPGETSKQVSVKVNGDTTVEPDEQFSVELSRPNGATIADGEGIGTIKNDDSATPPPPPPAKPDLTVTSLSRVSDAGADSCIVQFTIKNIGTAAADSSTASVHGHAGIAGNWNDYEDTPSLAPGASVQLTGELDHPCEGTAVTVTADTSADIDESDEDNNQLGTSF